MLLEFKVKNFLSIKDEICLDLKATNITDFGDTNIISTERNKVLKGAVIYGANSSGKSNLIKAMSTMRRIVFQSFEKSSTSDLNIEPFLLDTISENEPSFFEVTFLLNNIKYRYGFELTNTEIRSEWLMEAKKNVEKYLFVREKDGIDVNSNYKEAKDLEEKTRDNALFLAVIDQFNGKLANQIMMWFNNFITISGLSHEKYKMVTFQMLEKKESKELLQLFYNDLDLGFDDIEIKKKDFNTKDIPEEMPEHIIKQLVSDFEGKKIVDVKTLHKKRNSLDNSFSTVEFDMRSQESSGTNKIFNISGPIFDVLSDGGILVIDELDASLHPLLTLSITRMFNSTEHNPKNAQLIFSTHDTNLFSYGRFRRDQIYFTEKDKYFSTDLYSLVEYKGDGGITVRKDRTFEKDYIQGKYGAIPFIGNVSNTIKEWLEK
jgi:AAA15 family ATPase/GTPase